MNTDNHIKIINNLILDITDNSTELYKKTNRLKEIIENDDTSISTNNKEYIKLLKEYETLKKDINKQIEVQFNKKIIEIKDELEIQYNEKIKEINSRKEKEKEEEVNLITNKFYNKELHFERKIEEKNDEIESLKKLYEEKIDYLKERFEKEKDDLKNQLNEYQNEINKYEFQNNNNEIQIYKDINQDLKNNILKLENEMKEKNENIKSKEERLNGIFNELKELTSELLNYQNENNNLKNEKREIEEKNEKLIEEIDYLNDMYVSNKKGTNFEYALKERLENFDDLNGKQYNFYNIGNDGGGEGDIKIINKIDNDLIYMIDTKNYKNSLKLEEINKFYKDALDEKNNYKLSFLISTNNIPRKRIIDIEIVNKKLLIFISNFRIDDEIHIQTLYSYIIFCERLLNIQKPSNIDINEIEEILKNNYELLNEISKNNLIDKVNKQMENLNELYKKCFNKTINSKSNIKLNKKSNNHKNLFGCNINDFLNNHIEKSENENLDCMELLEIYKKQLNKNNITVYNFYQNLNSYFKQFYNLNLEYNKNEKKINNLNGFKIKNKKNKKTIQNYIKIQL